jgi:hypothetical protein
VIGSEEDPIEECSSYRNCEVLFDNVTEIDVQWVFSDGIAPNLTLTTCTLHLDQTDYKYINTSLTL